MVARASRVFVGRARELTTLDRVLDAARAGTAAAVLVTGEAGIGKTRLVSELGARARGAGFDVLVGHAIDLAGTELPYQPFVEALRAVGDPRRTDPTVPGSRLRVFERTIALLAGRAAEVPVLLVLEDLHWADVSTLDLVLWLAHTLDDQPVIVVGTCRADEPSSAGRMRRLADGLRRCASALVLELGPLERHELIALLDAAGDVPPPAAVRDAIATRAEGNPFFAEELLATPRDGATDLPDTLRDLLLQHVARLGHTTQDVVRAAAAAGGEVSYPVLRATAEQDEATMRTALRQAVDQRVLVVDAGAGTFRFRHALLAEAIRLTILPGEREALHARLAGHLAETPDAPPAELARHWVAAGRPAEALAASVDAARAAEAVAGMAEAHAHAEQAIRLWDEVPDAAVRTGLDRVGLMTWAAGLASHTGAASRAVALARQAIHLAGGTDLQRAALLHVRLGEYLHQIGSDDPGLAALDRAVRLLAEEPPSPAQAYSLGSLAGGLMMAWRFADSLPLSDEALALARRVGAREAEVRARTVRGVDLANLGDADEGLAELHRALRLAEQIDDHVGLERTHVNLTDVLTMLGRPREAARRAAAGLEAMRRRGIHSTVLIANRVEALLVTGEWDEADRISSAALAAMTESLPYMLLMLRADLELRRGDVAAARAHLDTARATLREDHGFGIYEIHLAELALWQHRWSEADGAAREALTRATSPQTAQLRAWFDATGLRAVAELAALARARRDGASAGTWTARADELVADARRAARSAAAVTPNASGWLALADAEHERARGVAQPSSWAAAAAGWDDLERPPLATYCRWRQAEALVAAGASRAEAAGPLRSAYTVAVRIGAAPLVRELEALAQRARLDPAPLEEPPPQEHPVVEVLGLTRREAEVLHLVAQGHTNREIAERLTISVKTASVHVSHILRKLDAPNRLEAAAIAHRLDPSWHEPPASH